MPAVPIFEGNVECPVKCRKVESSRFLKDQNNTNMLCPANPAKVHTPVPQFSCPRLASMQSKQYVTSDEKLDDAQEGQMH